MFETIAIIAIVLGVAIAVILILAVTKPGTLRVTRAICIDAPAERIFPLIDDFHQWTLWSPYENRDPAMKRIYSGAGRGQGAAYAWDGNKNVGAGRMEILQSSAPSKIVIKLDFIKAVRRPQHRRVHNAAAGKCDQRHMDHVWSGRLHVEGDAGVHEPGSHDRQGFRGRSRQSEEAD
ncbi:hypothetical protein ACVIHH_007429 [Bradyrhizobium sp. USDA 4518]